MALYRSLDESKIIAALLHEVHNRHGAVFNYSSLCKTLKKVEQRLSSEGFGFLSKTMPRLGKALDKALSGGAPLNSSDLRFTPQKGSKLPRFLGELFNEVLTKDGVPLQEPCINSVGNLRMILYCFKKYKRPYSKTQEQQVVTKFERTEDDLLTIDEYLEQIRQLVDNIQPTDRTPGFPWDSQTVVRRARRLLSSLLSRFDPLDIYPRHGPGSVATKQRLWSKYRWTNVSGRITDKYPLDAYFYASLGHVCDKYREFSLLTDRSLPAKVILVPKDSRGPRLISEEPVDYQWIQQGLGRALVKLVESHPLTKGIVNFTQQRPNQIGALLGSKYGSYATLDLNEASDRVSVVLVRLLFPPHICEYLEACRSLSTVLPNGKELRLRKFAPMGSSLCFPVLAITIWALLTAAAPDRYTRKRILVYGDDVIVPTAYAVNAMSTLSSFGLKINRDKSCTKGFFRESCGCDAYKGVDVTPVLIRTVWSPTPSPDSYCSWIAYANSYYDKKYYAVYDYIVERLTALYGSIPSKDMQLACPSLASVPAEHLPPKSRTNRFLQKKEWRVWTLRVPTVHNTMDGWVMLLRWFTEGLHGDRHVTVDQIGSSNTVDSLVSSYTDRGTSMLVKRWVPVGFGVPDIKIVSELLNFDRRPPKDLND